MNQNYAEGLLDELLGQEAPPDYFEFSYGRKSYKIPVSRRSRKSATDDETTQLAAILSHELSHILLAHYLETRASRKLFELFETVFTDCAAFSLS